MQETSATIARQYIDAVATFEALEEALEEAAQVRGQSTELKPRYPL